MTDLISAPLVAAVEAGGTKFVAAVGNGPGQSLLARREFLTGDQPEDCLSAVGRWLAQQSRRYGGVRALGIATFGPVDLHRDSPTYGCITNTPKPGWTRAPILNSIRRCLGELPAVIDTDVNGAALGERTWGAAQGLDDFIYITIGTGIGGGGMSGGRLLHGLLHPEMGHMRLPRLPGDDYPGHCPFHGDCWEGMCCGPALEARAGCVATEIPADHVAWQFTARYTANALANLTCVLSPRRIVLGGSVRKGGRLGETAFFHIVRDELQRLLNGYIDAPQLTTPAISDYIVPPLLGDDAGICGAIALAQQTLATVG